MAYQVDKFNGTFLVSVADGTIDTTTDIRFVGKNYAGYGEVQNENFLHLLESFSNTTAPPKAVTGQIWFDTSTKKLKVYDGTIFKAASGAEVSATAPTAQTQGDFWWDASAKQLYVWTGTEHELIGPEASPELGQTAAIPAVVSDDSELPITHPIIKFVVQDKVVAIISKDNFTLSQADSITGFSLIKQGYTLVDTNEDGITPQTPEADAKGYVHWGSASDALRLDGRLPSEYVLANDASFDSEAYFPLGYILGGSSSTDPSLGVAMSDTSTDTIFTNHFGGDSDIIFRMTVAPVTDERDVAVFNKDGLRPGQPINTAALYDLGSSEHKWRTIFAESLDVGQISGSISGDTSGNHYGSVYHWNSTTETSDNTIIINAQTKQIGYTGASLVGNLVGDVQGNVIGTATNATTLENKSGSVSVPTSADKSSVVIRATDGTIYATTFAGNASGADRLKINDGVTDVAWNAGDESTHYRSATTTKTAYTIAARNATGDLAANVFNGTATAARFADLAEKYLADADYEVGTVIAVGGEQEVTAAKVGNRAIGIVSENPAFMMNAELEGGTYIALKGRVPCKVVGPVTKGQRLVPSGVDGVACAAHGGSIDTFAIALETNEGAGEKIIEAIVL